MKKAVPVRMPDWPEEELPSTKQVEVYLLFWEHQQKPLAPDPGNDMYPVMKVLGSAKTSLKNYRTTLPS